MQRFLVLSIVVIASLFLLNSCAPDNEEDDFDLGINPTNDVISALPTDVIAPANNQSTTEKIELGRALFWDPVLSGNGDISCATCHHPNEGYADGIERSLGTGGTGLGTNRRGGIEVARNSPTIINTAFNGINQGGNYDPSNAEMFWDNRTRSLELQAIQPLLSAEEMRGPNISEQAIIDTVLNRLRNIPAYATLFQNSFGGTNPINEVNLGRAIAAFERSIIANDSPFDRYQRGDLNALTNQQINGMMQFIEVGCADCHSGPMLSDYDLHNISVPDDGLNDDGGGNNRFRTPTLRNLGSTAPYMHNGTFNSLQQVMQHYDRNGGNNNNLDPEFRDLGNLNNQNIQEIISFLNALNDNSFDQTIPSSVPSGMNPGGRSN